MPLLNFLFLFFYFAFNPDSVKVMFKSIQLIFSKDWSEIGLKYYMPVMLPLAAEASVCGSGSILKIQAIFKSAF